MDRTDERVRSAKFLTFPIPELGFVRISVQRTGSRISPAEAGRALAGMLAHAHFGSRHGFLPDDPPATDWPDWCGGAGQTTEAHLASLAAGHQARACELGSRRLSRIDAVLCIRCASGPARQR